MLLRSVIAIIHSLKGKNALHFEEREESGDTRNLLRLWYLFFSIYTLVAIILCTKHTEIENSLVHVIFCYDK